LSRTSQTQSQVRPKQLKLVSTHSVTGKDEALVEVKYCALNFFDILSVLGTLPFLMLTCESIRQMQGKYQTQPPMPHVAGHEVSLAPSSLIQRLTIGKFTGVVKSVPPGASLKVGTRVCGMYQGAFAEKVTAPWRSLIPVPDNMPWEEAAGALVLVSCDLVDTVQAFT
jgi:NADPH2:quinone reductase